MFFLEQKTTLFSLAFNPTAFNSSDHLINDQYVYDLHYKETAYGFWGKGVRMNYELRFEEHP